MNKLPLISIVIPTLNSEKDIARCLGSIFRQSYPKNRLEILVIDNGSSDKTLEIVKKFNVKVVHNQQVGNLYSKMLALRMAKGEYFIYFDSDIDLIGVNFFEKMVKPLEDDLEIAASFCRFLPKKSDPFLSRYLSYETLQRDPIYEFFSPAVADVVVQKGFQYDICEYSMKKIPPSGLCLYRRSILLEVNDIKKELKFMELDNLVLMIKAGHTRFAYVHGVGMHHPFVKNLHDLMKKRLRNISKNYLHQSSPRLYKWFDLKSINGLIRVFVWVIYATTLVGPSIRGIIKSFKYNDGACLYEPIVAFVETWVIIYGFVRYSLSVNNYV